MYLQNTNLSSNNMEKSRFRQFYDELPSKAPVAPKTAFVNEIAELCMVAKATVYCWLAGTQKPDKLRTSMIAKKLNVPAEELF